MAIFDRLTASPARARHAARARSDRQRLRPVHGRDGGRSLTAAFIFLLGLATGVLLCLLLNAAAALIDRELQ